MRKLYIILCLAILLSGICAFAEETRPMQIINCEEWVSMRREADTHSERVAKVPFGVTVEAYFSDDQFTYCEYDGIKGYILNDYLAELEEQEFGNYWERFNVDNGFQFFNEFNRLEGNELLINVRTEEGEIQGTYSAVADISGVSHGRVEVWEGGYFIISSDFEDRSNPIIRRLYAEAGKYFVTGDSGLSTSMYNELVEEFEEEYSQNIGTDYLFAQREDRIGRYVGVFGSDDRLEYWAFMGGLQ